MTNKAKDIETFSFSEWTVEVHRRAFRRSVSIYLAPRKPIKVVAGRSVSHKTIHEFLLAKRDWIEKSFVKFGTLDEKFPDRKIKAYESLPFLGKELPLKLVITLLNTPFASVQEDHLLLHIPRNEWSADVLTDEHPHLLAVLRDFYKREAVRLVSGRVAFWAGQMQLQPRTLKFREQRTRWGSCSSRGTINLNWRLIVFRPELIDYVIVHELSHLRHMNHSSDFWGLVEAHIPGYKILVKELREAQRLCEFLTL